MDTNRFMRVRKVFDLAMTLPRDQWDSFLAQACHSDQQMCAEVKELLLAHQSAATTEAGDQDVSSPSRMVGHYRILRELGAGGMGVVYLATREDGAFRKNVAVKLLKAGHNHQDLVQRFHQERQVLANLDHPNIARILDGGETPDGTPYHVMDYVEGLPLDRFCDEQRLNLADRIRLFQQVVAAVRYLHENLVVHRDLKPSNILVNGEGQVKLLDFGIAKLQTLIPETPDLTGPANRLLTPSYASPEQISGAPISKSSDIYSLGVILYELLTGRLPHVDASAKLSGMPQLPSANIREDLQRTPETTSQLRRRIVGDLDQIVLLCLRRDPRQRYSTAAALNEDLQRFLEGRSVLARREPIIERTVRFLKRNRVAVAVIFLLVVSGALGAWKTIQAQILTHQIEVRDAAYRRTLDSLMHGGDSNAASTAAAPKEAKAVAAAVPVRADDIRKLRTALEQNLVATWSSRATPARQALLEQTLRYLDGVRTFAIHNVALAGELASTYKDIGLLFEPGSRDLALHAYQNAALVIASASDDNPELGDSHDQWVWIRTRIRMLGGVIPLDITPKPSAGVPAPAHSSRREAASANNQEERQADQAPLLVVKPIDAAAYNDVERQLDYATAREKLADETMKELEEDLRKDGRIVHSDIKANYARISIALASARQAIARADLEGARENIEIANESARRVLSAVGHP
jgi:hypothetical protein